MGKLYLGTQAITPFVYNEGGGAEPGGNIKITAYDTSTGVISGGGFGSTPGYVYVLDRDTNTYVAQTVASWTPSSITLDTPVDLTTLEGTTSMAVVADDGTWSNKWLLTGDVAVTGWGKLYVQDPDTRSIYTVAITSLSDINVLYGDNNGYSRQLQLGGNTFYSDEIVGVQFGSSFDLTTLQNYFLAYMTNLVQPVVIPSSVTTIGNYFLYYSGMFNQLLVLSSNTTSIGNYFLAYCRTFNQPMIIPSGVTTIGEYFMQGCLTFNQPITIPSGVTSIGTNFLSSCYSFNQPVEIPSSITNIGDAFIYACSTFNQSITIPSSVTSIGKYFLQYGYAFNQPVTIPSSVTTIGERFMQACYAFNQPVTIPSSVTTIGQNFMNNCYAFSNLTVDTTAHPTDENSLAATYNTSKMYVKGVTVKGTGRSAWISALPTRTSNPYRKLIDGGE